MSWIDFLDRLVRVFPFLEKWVDLQAMKIPMKKKEHEEREDLRNINNDIKEQRREYKRDKRAKKYERKRNKRKL